MGRALLTAVLAIVAALFLLIGPVVRETGGNCGVQSVAAPVCTAGSSTHGLGVAPILLIPLAGSIFVATGAALRSRGRRGGAFLLVVGAATLWVICLLGLPSIGLFFLPAGAAALATARSMPKA